MIVSFSNLALEVDVSPREGNACVMDFYDAIDLSQRLGL